MTTHTAKFTGAGKLTVPQAATGPTHTYATSGTYPITLTAIDSTGKQASVTRQFTTGTDLAPLVIDGAGPAGSNPTDAGYAVYLTDGVDGQDVSASSTGPTAVNLTGTAQVQYTGFAAGTGAEGASFTTYQSTYNSGGSDGAFVVVPYSGLSVDPAAVTGGAVGLPRDSSGYVPISALPVGTGLQLRILSPAPDLQLIDVVPGAISATVMEEVKGDGAGSFQVQVDDPRFLESPELANYLNVVQVAVDGVIRGAFLLKNVHRQLIGQGENAQVVYEFSGPGLRDWFRHAVVYPENHNNLPLKDLQPGTRYFNFSAPMGAWYDSTKWSYPTRMVQVRDTTVAWTPGSTIGNPWGTAPVGWPDVQNRSVFWVWDRDARPTAPVGDVYFRREFATTDTKATYTLLVTADNSFEAYIDGVPLAAQNLKDAWHYLWEGAIDLSPGTHVLAIKASNSSAASPSGMAALLYKNGTTQDSVLNGDTNTNIEAQLLAWSGDAYWQCLGYPTNPPGFTAGAVLSQLINEAKARGVASMQRLTLGFSPTADSNGEPWLQPIDWTFDIGMTYYDVISHLEELACEIRVDPATFTVYAYNKQGTDRSVQTSSTQPVIFRRGHNVVTASEDSQINFVNSFLVSFGDSKVTEVVDTYGQIPTVGRIEGYAATDSSYNIDTATLVANKMLELGKDPVDSATLVITDVEDHTPWKNFKVGDWVLGPGSGGMKSRRVMSITVSAHQATGRADYEIELDSRSQDMADKIQQFLSRIPSFSAMGTSVAAGSSVGSGGGDTVTPIVDPGSGGGVDFPPVGSFGGPGDGSIPPPIGLPPDPTPIPAPYIPPTPPPVSIGGGTGGGIDTGGGGTGGIGGGGFTDYGGGTGIASGIVIYFQPDEPTGAAVGSFWYDTDGEGY